MSQPTAIKHLIPPDLLPTPDLLVAVTGRSEARLVADRPLPELADQTHDELRDASLTPAAARRLACALELGRRLHITPLRPGVQLKTAEQVFLAYEPQLRNLKKERFLAVLLDARSRVIRVVTGKRESSRRALFTRVNISRRPTDTLRQAFCCCAIIPVSTRKGVPRTSRSPAGWSPSGS